MKKQNYSNMYISLGIIILLLLVGFNYFQTNNISNRLNKIDNILKDVPKMVCHIEEKFEKYIIPECDEGIILSRGHPEYSYDTEITCEEGIEIGDYESFNLKVIYDGCHNANKVCLIKTYNEVCEIK